MHLRKTGALIRAAAVSGAIMAGGDDDTVDAVDRWAAEIGLAFQIVDDILDVEGDAASSARPPARTPPATSRPTRRSSGSSGRAPWPTNAASARADRAGTAGAGGSTDGWLHAAI